LPARAPSLPDRALPDRALPDRTSTPRTPALPRPSDKELPQAANAAPPVPTPRAAKPSPITADLPAASHGQRPGSPQGAGPVTVTASDFPFAWYLAAVQRKIQANWDQWAQPGRQPIAVFAIDRDGRVSEVAIDKTSGNAYYDQKALRAINDAV